MIFLRKFALFLVLIFSASTLISMHKNIETILSHGKIVGSVTCALAAPLLFKYYALRKVIDKSNLEDVSSSVKDFVDNILANKSGYNSSIKIKATKINTSPMVHAFYDPNNKSIILEKFKPLFIKRENDDFKYSLQSYGPGILACQDRRDQLRLLASNLLDADFFEMDLDTAIAIKDELEAGEGCDSKNEQKIKVLERIEMILNKYKAILQHEAKHIKQFENPAHKYRYIISSLVAGSSSLALFYRYKKNWFSRLFAPISAFVINLCLHGPWARYLETGADDSIDNDRQVLLAFKKWLEEICLKQYFYIAREGIIYEPGNCELNLTGLHFLKVLQNIVGYEHPSSDFRSARIKQRIDRIEKMNDNEDIKYDPYFV